MSKNVIKLTPDCKTVNRRAGGYQLIELLVATGIISALMVGILDGLALVHRQSNSAQNQLIASNIAQELIDQARNQDWNTLLANLGTRTILVNRYSGGQRGSGYNQRPVMLDMSTLSYSQAGGSNLFAGSVAQTLANAGPGRLQLMITVNWAGEHGGARKTLVMSSMISQFGIHN